MILNCNAVTADVSTPLDQNFGMDTKKLRGDIEPILVRMPSQLRERLRKAANKAHRSESAEAIYRIQQSLDAESTPVAEEPRAEYLASPKISLTSEQAAALRDLLEKLR